jgi:ketosteroid isomerase-like protein
MRPSFKFDSVKNSNFSKFLVPGILSMAAFACLSQSSARAADAVAAKADFCAVKCNEPHPACSESAKVIDTLHHITQLINDGDFATMADFFDDGVTTFNEDNKRLIIGKEAVIADLKERYAQNHKCDGKLVSYTIDKPYAEVNGNRAVVTFVAKKVLTGSHPVEMESHSTEVFVKEGDKWKTLHYRGAWKKMS